MKIVKDYSFFEVQLVILIILFDPGKKSISSQYHGRLSTTPRNTAVINAAWQSRTEPETSRKREELKKRIEETRRKLQSVRTQIILSPLFSSKLKQKAA